MPKSIKPRVVSLVAERTDKHVEVSLTPEQVQSLVEVRLLEAIGLPSFPFSGSYSLSDDGKDVLVTHEVSGHNRDIETLPLRPATDDDRTVFAAIKLLRAAARREC